MKRLLVIIGCLSALFFTACNKELSDNFTTYPDHPLNDTAWVKNVANTASINDLFDVIVPDIIVDSFNAGTSGTLRYGDSLEIAYDSSSFVTNGTSGTLSGKARIEITQLKRKGDFIKIFRPTTTSNGSLLETGGGLYIRASKDDKELSVATGKTIQIKYSDLDSSKPNMQIFYGREGIPVPIRGIDTSFSWIRDFDTSYLSTWSKISTNPLVPSYYGYTVKSKNLHWITADRYVDSTLPKTKVTAILSPNYTNKNTAVFAVFANQKTVVSLRGDYASRSFFANNIPLKSAIKLVSLSKIGGDFYLGVKDISSVAIVTSYTIVPDKKSLSEIIKFLNSL